MVFCWDYKWFDISVSEAERELSLEIRVCLVFWRARKLVAEMQKQEKWQMVGVLSLNDVVRKKKRRFFMCSKKKFNLIFVVGDSGAEC